MSKTAKLKPAQPKPAPNPGPRRQYAALPWRFGQEVEIMLVSSRETRRWVVPKGWPMKGRKPSETAAVEAMEEAGLVGEISVEAIGSYHYVKRRKNGATVLCRVDLFPLHVTRQRKTWPERDQRTTRWFSVEEAAEAVAEPELRDLIRSFLPEPTEALAASG